MARWQADCGGGDTVAFPPGVDHCSLGRAVFLLSLVGVFFFEPKGGSPAKLILIPMMLSMLTGIGALIYMAIAGSINLLGCSQMDGNCVWLTGASPEFLAHLPDWSTQGPLGALGVLRGM